ncbi:hypothetical protein Tco_0174502 [Tanacetum coccineum]|uniref:Uncharacterized protein n=1 Tax=Tanacetum coccineum TaxID=301880 RepID=A0ABQ4WQA4_9ASTR
MVSNLCNPRYLKKAQSDKPCLYEIPYDTSDPANRFAPDREETMTLDNEIQMKTTQFARKRDSNVFRKEREQYHEIQDLKAQMQDKNIAISELKKLIEMFKRKGVDTNFEQPSILGKPPVTFNRNQTVVKHPTAYKC